MCVCVSPGPKSPYPPKRWGHRGCKDALGAERHDSSPLQVCALNHRAISQRVIKYFEKFVFLNGIIVLKFPLQ